MEEIVEIEHNFEKNSKKPQDQNAPKRPMSAYFLWANNKRGDLMKESPNVGVAELGKKLGSLWAKVSGSEKEIFEAKAKKQKEAYEKKIEKYRKTADYKTHQKNLYAFRIHQTKKPFPRDPNAPKRNLSAYMIYLNSVRENVVKENPGMSSVEIMKEQSMMWKALNDEERMPFKKKAEAEKAKYSKRLERYMKTAEYIKWAAERDDYKSAMVEKRRKLLGIKKKRARSQSKGRESKKQKRSASKKRRKSKTPKARKGSKSRSRSRKSKRESRRRKSRSVSRKRSSKRSKKKSRRSRK